MVIPADDPPQQLRSGSRCIEASRAHALDAETKILRQLANLNPRHDGLVPCLQLTVGWIDPGPLVLDYSRVLLFDHPLPSIGPGNHALNLQPCLTLHETVDQLSQETTLIGYFLQEIVTNWFLNRESYFGLDL